MCTPAKIAWEYARVHAVGLLLQKQPLLQPHSNVVGITINPCHCEKKPVVVRQNLSWYQHTIGRGVLLSHTSYDDKALHMTISSVSQTMQQLLLSRL